MDKRKNPHELLWDLIRKNGNNKTVAAQKVGMYRQLFNYYANHAKKLPDELVRKVIYALNDDEQNPIVHSSSEFISVELKQINLAKVFHAMETNPVLTQAEKETHLSIRKAFKEILYAAIDETNLSVRFGRKNGALPQN